MTRIQVALSGSRSYSQSVLKTVGINFLCLGKPSSTKIFVAVVVVVLVLVVYHYLPYQVATIDFD